MVTVYYDQDTNKCVIQNKKYSSGNFVSEITGGKLTLWKNDRLLLDKIPVSDIVDKAGTAYASEAALETALNNFFVDASDAAYWGGVAEATYSYGILIDGNFSTPLVTRVGNLELHKTLPIHSLMRGCLLLDDGTVNYYLDPNDWSKKADGTAANHTGADGMVMVEIPEYYTIYRSIDDIRKEVRISQRPLPGYQLKPKRYVSAYKATVQRSNNKLASVINTDADFRGGNNDATKDALPSTQLGRSASNISLTNFRAYARNRAAGTRWNCMTYDIKKSIFWLFAIEYGNLNSQAAVSAKDPVNGYMQGGLGNGVTNASSAEWNAFNGYYPFVPCGASNILGNKSGEVTYTAVDFEGTGINRNFTVSRYRGIESPFGETHDWTDGILIDVKSVADGGTSTLYTTNDPSKFSSTDFANYIMRGLVSRSSGYVRNMIFGVEGDIIPTNVTGGSTTYYADYFYTSVTESSLRGVYFGGAALDGASAGLVYALSNSAPSIATTNIGSRLCFV